MIQCIYMFFWSSWELSIWGAYDHNGFPLLSLSLSLSLSAFKWDRVPECTIYTELHKKRRIFLSELQSFKGKLLFTDLVFETPASRSTHFRTRNWKILTCMLFMLNYGFKYNEKNDYQYWFEREAMPRLSRQQREQVIWRWCMLVGKLPKWLQMTSTAVLGQLNVYVIVTMHIWPSA